MLSQERRSFRTGIQNQVSSFFHLQGQTDVVYGSTTLFYLFVVPRINQLQINAFHIDIEIIQICVQIQQFCIKEISDSYINFNTTLL